MDAPTTSDLPPRLRINPPLFNSANPWATTLDDLRGLYQCAATGAVTTRTALLDKGFPHNDKVHRYAFFETGRHKQGGANADASLNTLGYSPIPLDEYLAFIRTIVSEGGNRKPFIVSVTGSPDEVAECYRRIARCAREYDLVLAMEVNLSCPNIPGRPPPAYDGAALRGYLRRVTEVVEEVASASAGFRIPWGVKTPPYTHAGEFEMVASALRDCAIGVSSVGFVTAVNTLGSCLVLGDDEGLGLGVGGLAGAPVHPLALGNVASLRRLLDLAPETCRVDVLGIGGVGDAAGYRRMRRVGAAAVGVGTALGIKGLGVFEEIERGLGGVWEA